MPGEPRIPEELVTATREGRLVPFVGAGVSRNVRSPEGGAALFRSWSELVQAASERLASDGGPTPDSEYVAACARLPSKLLQGAQHARDALGLGAWNVLLVDEFAKDVPRDAQGLELARSVWLVASDLVLTTNYDGVLKTAAGGPVFELHSGSKEMLAEIVRRPQARRTIWYVHGDPAQMEEMILTLDSYALLWPSEANARARAELRFEAAQLALSQLLLTRNLLFVGSSVEDVVLKKLHDLQRVFGGTSVRHFALFRDERERDDLLHRIERLEITPRDLGLEPIVAPATASPDPGPGPLVRYLRRLHWDASPRRVSNTGLVGKAYRRHNDITLQGDEAVTTLEVRYDQVGAAACREREPDVLRIPFTFDYIGNVEDIAVQARLEAIDLLPPDAPAGARARFEEPFDPKLHSERFANAIVCSGIPAVQPRSLRVRVRGRGMYAVEPGREDFSEFVSNGCFDVVEIAFRWRRPLRPERFVAKACGADGKWVGAESAQAIEGDACTCTVRARDVRVGTRLRAQWTIGRSP